MPSWAEFRGSINEDTCIDDDFCKRLLGYAYYNPERLEDIKFICQAIYDLPFYKYEEWYGKWVKSQEKSMKSVAAWYRKRLDDEWERKKVRQQSECRRNTRHQFAGFPEDW